MADILSQDEVDLLLNAVSEGDFEGEQDESGRGEASVHLITYDFRRPERVSKEQLKGLQSLFEAFSREVSIVFPPFLRTVVRLDLTSIDQLTYDEFILSVSRPTSLTVVNLAPLEGTAVMEMSPAMVFPIVDRVLGGRGLALPEPRELTEIESRIVQRIVYMLLDCLKRAWAQLIEFEMTVEHQESDPLIVQIVAGSEMVILVGYEIHVGEAVGTMNLCIPLMVLNPVLDQISQQAQFTRRHSSELTQHTRRELTKIIRRSEVPVEAILGRASLTIHDIATLRVGDVIQLNTSPNDDIEIHVGSQHIFRGRPGRQGDRSAVLLDSVVRNEGKANGEEAVA